MLCRYVNALGNLKPRTTANAQGRKKSHSSIWTTSPKTGYVSDFHSGLVQRPIAIEDGDEHP